MVVGEACELSIFFLRSKIHFWISLIRCESEECLVRNSGSDSPLAHAAAAAAALRQSPQGEDMGCQVGGGGGAGQDQAEEEEQMLGSQLAELQQKLDRSVYTQRKDVGYR